MGSTNSHKDVVSGQCISGTSFKINNKEVDWKHLKCSSTAYGTAKYTGNNCEGDGKEIEIGFDIGDRFLRSILICFNQTLQVVHYTFINQTASINQRALNVPRPAWIQGSGFYDIGSVTDLYKRAQQRKTINTLLGLSATSTKYIQDNNYFLSRGHTTARSDQFYGAQQNATFFLMNVAPQWQSFNGFNWNQVEIDVRDYGEANSVNLQVWTGVHGIAKLPHEKTGELTELYLYVDESTGRKALPVPELYWKVAYDPQTERGVALIGVNNPYNSTLTTICNDISSQLNWVNWKKNDQSQGFCYACRIDTFRRVVTNMPNVPVKGLLI